MGLCAAPTRQRQRYRLSRASHSTFVGLYNEMARIAVCTRMCKISNKGILQFLHSSSFLYSSCSATDSIQHLEAPTSSSSSSSSSHPSNFRNAVGRWSGGKLTWYSCGPTVYDVAHIGHARTYVCTDVIRRILTDVLGKDVDFAMGVTDIDDKIIDRGLSKGLKHWPEMETMVRGLEDEFFADLDLLNVRRPDAILRVTEHIDEIIRYIDTIEKSGRAYLTPDGVYFDVASSGDAYLQFNRGVPSPSSSSSSQDDLNAHEQGGSGGSIGFGGGEEESSSTSSSSSHVVGHGHKRDRRDFALWKKAKPGEPTWDSPWGPGRPGWHIECSAVTHAYFGPALDIHSGGVDLMFPHHTNEIAQCSAHNCTAAHEWVTHWIHTGHLYIEGRKMSKSLKNFISIRDYLQGGYSSQPATDFRLFCLQHKYHSSVHFAPDRIHDAATFRRKIESFLRLVEVALASSSSTGPSRVNKPSARSRSLQASLSSTRAAVFSTLGHEFNTPEALRLIGELVGVAMPYVSAVVAGGVSSHGSVESDGDRSVGSRGSCRSKDGGGADGGGSNTNSSNTRDGSNIVGIRASEPLPVQPLQAVALYVTDILGKLGVNLSAGSGAGSGGSRLGVGMGDGGLSLERGVVSGEKAVKALLEFRSRVRLASLTGMKALSAEAKARKKAGATAATTGSATATAMSGAAGAAIGTGGGGGREASAVAQQTLSEVLLACDWMRDTQAPQELGIQIEDVSEAVSTWKPLEK